MTHSVDLRLLFVLTACLTGVLSLTLSRLPFFSTPSLSRKIQVAARGTSTATTTTWTSIAERYSRVAEEFGERFSRVVGIATPLVDRLRLAERQQTPREFRMRQAGLGASSAIAVASLAILTGGTMIVIGLAAGVGLLVAVGIYEEMLGQAVKKNRQSVNAELAQFGERLAMMCLAGSSASSALLRIGTAGDTALRRAVACAVEQTKNGMGLAEALKHETAMFNAPGLDRVIRLIAAQHETPNLAQLLQQQAALQRSEAHRQLIADLDKRSQTVWIPVTVATLVPGVIFLAVPFLSALQPLNN